MSKKDPLPPPDNSTFRDAMKDVTPLKQDKRKPSKKPLSKPRHPPPPRREPPPALERLYPAQSWLEPLEPEDWLSSEDPLHFARTGLQRKLLMRLKRGQIQIEAHIDLHRQTTEEAMHSVTHFIDDCKASGKRWVCMIHGKGHYSAKGKPVLKNFLNQWLRTCPDVLAFHSAKPKHGGTGALYVLLKR